MFYMKVNDMPSAETIHILCSNEQKKQDYIELSINE